MADEQATINLRVLSPSAELEGGVAFAQLPTCTTIAQLRSRIQAAVPSKPSPQRMRLIYRGRVVADDSQSLEAVFGADNVRDNKDQSLHLVLPPAVPDSASPAPPNPFRAAPAPAPAPAASPPPTNPFRAVPPAGSTSPPHTPQPPHHHHPPDPANPLGIPIPAPLQHHLAHALAQAGLPEAQHAPGQAPPPWNPAFPNPPLNAQRNVPSPGLATPPGFGMPNAAPNSARTVRQEGVGPNGVRWSVTVNEMNVPVQGQNPFPLNQNPPGLALPGRPVATPDPADAIPRLLPRLRTMVESARQEMDNARALHQTPVGPPASQPASTTPPSWRVGRIRMHLQNVNGNLALAEREQNFAVANTSSSHSAMSALAELRRSIYELRTQAEEISRGLDQEPGPNPNTSTDAGPPSSNAPAAPVTTSSETAAQPPPFQPPAQATASTVPAHFPPELFLLSSPRGPVGIIFDQGGTYTTAPIVPTLPFQTFTNQFAQNRQLIAGLGQQIAHGNGSLQNQFAVIPPTPAQQPGTGDAQLEPQNENQNQVQNAQAAQAQNRAANPPAAENDRLANLGGHVWLILKLACFVYFFAGGGSGYYRPILLGIVAGIVYLAQIGMFEEYFSILRRHIEALLPVGAMERVAAPVAQQAGNVSGDQQNVRTGNGNVTPEQAAQRLLQQRRDQRFGWVREGLRGVERVFALFVASLWPGIGERMVYAQEERERLERVARREEEERREAEEKRRQEEEEKRQAEGHKKDDLLGQVGGASVGGEGEAAGSSKGKERADDAPATRER